jgi:hypothetical protein
MNNKGQSLILFVIVIPLIFIFGVFVFDLSNVYSQNSRLENLAYDALYNKYTYHKTIAEMKKYIYLSDPKVKIDELTDNTICLSKNTEPIFGDVVGYKYYTVKACYEASVTNSILRINEKDD